MLLTNYYYLSIFLLFLSCGDQIISPLKPSDITSSISFKNTNEMIPHDDILEYDLGKLTGNIDKINTTVLKTMGILKPLPDQYIDSELEIYYKDFLSLSKKNKIEFPPEKLESLIWFGFVDKLSKKVSPKATAICIRTKYKTFEKSSWVKKRKLKIEVRKNKFDHYKKEAAKKPDPNFVSKQNFNSSNNNALLIKKILFHELTHCLRGFGHLPASYVGEIMSASYNPSQNLTKDWDQYLENLFSKEYEKLMPKLP